MISPHATVFVDSAGKIVDGGILLQAMLMRSTLVKMSREVGHEVHQGNLRLEIPRGDSIEPRVEAFLQR